MAWSDPDGWLTRAWSPHASTIIITALIVLFVPIILHVLLYHSAPSHTLPSFLLLGPSGSGKTTLLAHFETSAFRQTHTSQSTTTSRVSLPSSTTPKSDQYRSVHDPALKSPKNVFVTDTPGHAKLRHVALESLKPIQPNAKKATPKFDGIVFVIDSTAVNPGTSALEQTAEYLHDVLLLLQKRHTRAKTSRHPPATPVLIAANKADLFTALPADMIRKGLESEIERIRQSRRKGVLTVGSTEEERDDEREEEWLGEGGDGAFEFEMMRESDVKVDVVGGSASTGDVTGWWEWIANQM
ncbi:P-loop containing nucleoside triphosphate hydrolase protein [Eremomyces bilateralis CBS 781.70]|uniref:Signal recognition particle receptor subunit beta n=1 Tax=Eremomyces bilateralis CBS 781.70 TaxID=1392243 RepID=A0A6G1G5F5_9PEZI|nr:P-loop containing nucleoside triphosphate hydrolase protein [Eremomyces bilateralis CBS 781.70]KAF1813325.1 P-loop containing nucleoside triphosphate hydrolase protein [Eremomyces bilateralis CBS 781.70]